MGTRKSTFTRILILGCAAALCLGATYTWTGASDTHWDNDSNWSCSCLGYPDDTDDDAIADGTYTIDLVTVSIDDLTLTGTITLGDADSNDPTLTVNSLTVTGDSTVELTEGSTVVTTSS